MPRYSFSFAFIINFLILCASGQGAWADTSISSTDANSNNVDVSQQYVPDASNSASSLNSQQTGIVQFNNSGYGTLGYPNCAGVCAFGVLRLVPNASGNSNHEAIMGVVIEFDSPQKRYAKAQQGLKQAESDRMSQEDEVLILTKLADAVEQCKDSHANLLAIAAAKRLNMTPEELLSLAYKQPRKCNSQVGS
jgi:hypothetical protein